MESLKSRSNRSLRAFCREWKRFKPVSLRKSHRLIVLNPCNSQHLHKSTSLPALQLIPLNKPRFTCRRCGFANTYVPLCLWCTWSSDEDTSKWEKEMPRHRRISAPSRASTSIPAVPPIPPTSRIASENTGCDPQTDIPPSLASDREKGPLPPPSYSIHQSMVRETYFATISVSAPFGHVTYQ